MIADTYTATPVYNIKNSTVSVADQTFTGSKITPTPTVEFAQSTLQEGVDYTVEHRNNVNAGVAEVVITGMGSYKGTASKEFTIKPASISTASVSGVSDQTYTGRAIEPNPAISLQGYPKLVRNTDYTVAYENNVNAGAAKVTIAGTGNYTDVLTRTFKINPVRITAASGVARTYTGKAQATSWTVKAGGLAVPAAGFSAGGYKANTNAGTASATITGRGNFTGSVRGTFQIRPLAIGIASPGTQPWTGKAVKAKPKVTAGGRTLREGTDYTLSYRNNVNAGTATVTATGRGNYTGTKSVAFKIVAPSVQYFVHRQTYGWEKAWSKANGRQSGTTGQAKRLEAIRVRMNAKPVAGSIRYRTHVQRTGWRGWKADGTMSGTEGQAKRLEAIQVQLTGQMAKLYDVYYRVHAQTHGWLGWAKNGQKAGTAGYAKRLEAIQIVIVPKSAKAPGATYQGAKQQNASRYISSYGDKWEREPGSQ